MHTERQHDMVWHAGMRAWQQGHVRLGTLRDVAARRARAYARRHHPSTPREYAELVLRYGEVFSSGAIYAAGTQADETGDTALLAEVYANAF